MRIRAGLFILLLDLFRDPLAKLFVHVREHLYITLLNALYRRPNVPSNFRNEIVIVPCVFNSAQNWRGCSRSSFVGWLEYA